MSTNMSPNLVLIHKEGVAVRYVNGKNTGEKAQLDLSSNLEQQKRELEYFRKNGFDVDKSEEQ